MDRPQTKGFDSDETHELSPCADNKKYANGKQNLSEHEVMGLQILHLKIFLYVCYLEYVLACLCVYVCMCVCVCVCGNSYRNN